MYEQGKVGGGVGVVGQELLESLMSNNCKCAEREGGVLVFRGSHEGIEIKNKRVSGLLR